MNPRSLSILNLFVLSAFILYVDNTGQLVFNYNSSKGQKA